MSTVSGAVTILGIIILLIIIGNIIVWGGFYLASKSSVEEKTTSALFEKTCEDTTLKLVRTYEVSLGRGPVETLYLEFTNQTFSVQSKPTEIQSDTTYAIPFPMDNLVKGNYWLSSSYASSTVATGAWNVVLDTTTTTLPDTTFTAITACLASHEEALNQALATFTPTVTSTPNSQLWVPKKINSVSAIYQSQPYQNLASKKTFRCDGGPITGSVYVATKHGSQDFEMLRGLYSDIKVELATYDYYWSIELGENQDENTVSLDDLLQCTNKDNETLATYIDRYKEIVSENNF